MTVGDLKNRLAEMSDDLPVILQKDAEGNGYSPLSWISREKLYEPESDWSGEVYGTESDYDLPENAVRAVVLGPVN
jgi:hypothetical protein